MCSDAQKNNHQKLIHNCVSFNLVKLIDLSMLPEEISKSFTRDSVEMLCRKNRRVNFLDKKKPAKKRRPQIFL